MGDEILQYEISDLIPKFATEELEAFLAIGDADYIKWSDTMNSADSIFIHTYFDLQEKLQKQTEYDL